MTSAGVERYLLTDWEHDTVWESLPLCLAPSVLLTGSLQWISLLCVCLLSHCGGRQTHQSPEAAFACLAMRGLYMWVRPLSWSCAVISLSLRKLHHCVTSIRHAVEFIRDGPSACATTVTVFHILLWEAGIHQPDQMCQHVTYHSSGSSPASTRFALNATLYDVKEKIQPWRLIWPEDKAVVGKCDGLILKQG